MGKGKPALQKIAEQFGSEVLNTDGTLNRDILGSMVFGNDQKRQKLNDITHPEILKEINDLINKYRIEGKKIVIIEAALIVEREKLKEMIDKLIVVSASEDIQIERLEKRNGLTREQALMRINSQIPIEEKIKQADYVINNDSDLNNINTQVKIIWEDLNLPAD